MERIRLCRIAGRAKHKLDAMIHVLEQPDEHQANGNQHGYQRVERLLFAVDGRNGAIESDHFAVTGCRIEYRTMDLGIYIQIIIIIKL